MLLAHKIVFSDEHKTVEIRKKKVTYGSGMEVLKHRKQGHHVELPTELQMNRIIY